MESNSNDEFAYLKRSEFTSEIFKIELSNLPRHLGITTLRKKMINMGLKPCKIKCVVGREYAFVTFRCEEDRNKAIELLDGCVWKKKNIKIKIASANPDPLIIKRKLNAEMEDNDSDNKRLKNNYSDTAAISDKLNDIVTPLWKIPYSEQLENKNKSLISISKELTKQIEKNNQKDIKIFQELKLLNNGLCFQLNAITPSILVNGYRNKSEFTIGRNILGEEYEVGFRIGSYKEGDLSVVAPQNCTHICENAKYVAELVKMYLKLHSTRTSFDASTRMGYWKQATVRCTKACSLLCLILVIHPQELSQEEITEEKDKLKKYFVEMSDVKVTSVYFQIESDRKEINEEGECFHIFGSKYIEESINGLNFRISPLSFFQVNTSTAELLYSRIEELCLREQSGEAILLDICCGIGSIALTLAKKFKKVIGIELSNQAIKDANENTLYNEIKNAEFINGRVEDVLGKLLTSLNYENIVAVVDPPRAGLHGDVIRAIRRSGSIKRLIYVSCKYKAALQNITDLTRQTSRRILGNPFHVKEVFPIDLFPQTEHYETVLLLQRT